MFSIKRNKELERITIIELYKMYKRNELDDTPYYQRFSNLWQLEKKRLLIDTIINGYDIPKFYFHYILTNNNQINPTNKKYAIIDGKQRLLSIFEFIENKYHLDESVKLLESEEFDLSNLKYHDLVGKSEYLDIKSKIDNYPLDIIHIVTDEYERVEEMFLRLNEGLPVNNAEKRNSIGGFLIEEINKLVKSNDFLLHKVKFMNRRMEHQDLIAKLALIENSDNLESFTKPKLDALVRKYKVKKNSSDSQVKNLKNEAKHLIEQVSANLSKLSDYFINNDDLLRYKGIIPLYYIFLKKNKSIGVAKFSKFLKQFEAARVNNRKVESNKNYNTSLLQFDRLN